MSKLGYKVEDFVLDPDFKKWVLNPCASTNTYWEAYLKKNPSKYHDAILARKIIINISKKKYIIDDSLIDETWNNIDRVVSGIDRNLIEKRAIPLDANSTLRKYEIAHYSAPRNYQWYRMIGILAFALSLSVVMRFFLIDDSNQVTDVPIIYKEHYAPPGVKVNLILPDGSKVMLNSGSSLRYISNFEINQREVTLTGEGYFEVAKDTTRPFKVISGPVTTIALGTSFNIRSYDSEILSISLLEGLVEVNMDLNQPQKVRIEPGEAIYVNRENHQFQKLSFDESSTTAWTRKTILFKQASFDEIKKVLEKWYGVKIEYRNIPKDDLEISGEFFNQTLNNVLEGLSHSARFDYELKDKNVFIKFH